MANAQPVFGLKVRRTLLRRGPPGQPPLSGATGPARATARTSRSPKPPNQVRDPTVTVVSHPSTTQS